MLRLGLPRHELRFYKDKGIVYCPDFIIYDFFEDEYQDFWNEISNHRRDYLYTDGIKVIKVGMLRAYFEWFKGWLGFENHCHPSRVELTLAKIAYAGYLKGFHSQTLQKIQPPLISKQFIDLVSKPKNNASSETLQHLLISYYKNHSEDFPPLEPGDYTNYQFGQIFLKEGLYSFLPSLDLQNDSFIKRAIDLILDSGKKLTPVKYTIRSKFAAYYAAALIEQEEDNELFNIKAYQEALKWDPTVEKKFKKQFIQFYFTDPSALAKAFELINEVALSLDPDDQAEAITYISENIDFPEQLEHLQNYPELRKKVALFYVMEAKRERDKWFQFLTGNKMLPFLTHALNLEPMILEHQNPAPEIKIMKEEWTIHLFATAIIEARFQDAENLYEKNPGYKFNKKDLANLVHYYDRELSTHRKKLITALSHQNTEQAQTIAQKQIELAKKRTRIYPQDVAQHYKANLDYAHTLLKIDEIRHPEVATSDLSLLREAQNYLVECRLQDDQRSLQKNKIEIFNQILLRKIDCLIIKLGVPIGCDNWEERRVFATEHQTEIDELKNALSTYIQLNSPAIKTEEMRIAVARAHYLLADTMLYFEERKQDALPHFKRTVELVPKNPYYRIHYYSLVNDDSRREKAKNEIDSMGHIHLTTYYGHMEERWNAERILAKGFNIHAPQVNGESSFLQALGLA
mgnify:CR=1 FL=1